nr:hypothetical protein [Moorena producens]
MYQASRRGDVRVVRRLQKTLMKSWDETLESGALFHIT